MSQVQETGKAPVSERPSQVNDTAEQVGKQAERRTCRTCGHPDCPYPTNDDVAAKVAEDPDWLKHPECWQPLALDGLKDTSLAPSRPDYEAVIQGVMPGAPVKADYYVFGCYTRPGGEFRACHTKGEAKRIVAAIVACIPGPVTVTDEIHNYSRWFKVKAQDGGLEFTVYYGHYERNPQ